MSNPLATTFAGIPFKNPVTTASGTFGFGDEYANFYDLTELGGLCTKGLTLEPRLGNKGQRLYETPSGLINSIGLENPGIDHFVERIWPHLKTLPSVTIANVSGSDENSYLEALRRLNAIDVPLIELNISCPNVKAGGMAYGTSPDSAANLTAKAVAVSRHPIMVKLTPNVSDIVSIAKACEEAGAVGLSLINTIQAMAVDVHQKKIVFDNIYAGLSGPAVFPIALRMVHQVCKAVDIPVMGVGGIATWEDALAMMMVGATCIQVGVMNFIDPYRPIKIIEGLKNYCEEEGLKSIEEIRGILL
ncbi:MAG: dihydroorotate dehydrogenase [Eubacteriaceae bacterium]|jgi:dihydroorotate dehydrogenase (NAD+) catalytic subunit|nr:dihydroorotate dehydrogenase [Eubacteriaceae bacterium]